MLSLNNTPGESLLADEGLDLPVSWVYFEKKPDPGR